MNPADHRPVFYRLLPAVQAYEWGNGGSDGLIRRLLEKQGRTTEEGPLAEMWKGAHPSAPSRIRGHHFTLRPGQLHSEEKRLSDAICQDPDHFLGHALSAKGYRTLPFLFKVLDAAGPLSIQAHPDRVLAQELHRRDPKNYPDDNHKPELAISLGHFEALVGFRPVGEFLHQLEHLPSLAALCRFPPGMSNDPTALYRSVYATILRATPEQIRDAAQGILHRLGQARATRRDEWFLHLVEFYGQEDPGILAIYLLNYVKLQPGEGIYLGPNEPHAYLKGEILECMASSDNVVRGGLTGKFRDVETLLSMLSYESRLPEILLPVPEGAAPYPAAYPTPAPDFRVSVLHRPERPVATVALRPLSILLLLEGTATLRAVFQDAERSEPIGEGEALFVPGDLPERGVTLFLDPSPDSRIFEASTRL